MISGDNSVAQGKKGAFYHTLAELHQHWERIDILCPRAAQTVNCLFGHVFIHCAPDAKIWQWRFIRQKGQELFGRERFDVMAVQSYPPFYNDLGAWLLKRKINIPYLLEIHHIIGYPRAADLKERLYFWLGKFLWRFLTRPAAAVRVVNQKQAPDFLSRHGVPWGKIKYIPSAYLDLSVFQPRAVEKKYDLVLAARLEKNKGILNLLKAVKIAKKQKPNLTLLLIGEGGQKLKLQKYVANNNLAANVIFAGWVATVQKLALAYNRSRIFINPSLNEGGPRVLLEAMACGLPALSTKVGLAPELIKDGENGFLFDWSPRAMADKINKLLKRSDLPEIGERARLAVRSFDRQKTIPNYAQEIKKLALKN